MRLVNKSRQESQVTDQSILKPKGVIDGVLPDVNSLDQLKERLLSHGFKTYLGRGVAFYNIKTRMKVKGSDIGRDYSLANLKKRIGITPKLDVNRQPQKQKTLQKKRRRRIA